MNPNDWIEIKPGCRMPGNDERVRVIVAYGNAWFEAYFRSGEDLADFYTTSAGRRLKPTHWMPIVPPPEPDPFNAWWDNQPEAFSHGPAKPIAARAFRAGVEHGRKQQP